MVELKAILDNLRTGAVLLGEKIAELAEKSKRAELAETKATNLRESLDAKAKDLDARESKVKNVENIVEAKANADKLLKEAQEEKRQSDVRQKALDEDIKKFREEKALAFRKIADAELMNKKQAEALIKERKEFDDKVRAFKLMSAVMK